MRKRIFLYVVCCIILISCEKNEKGKILRIGHDSQINSALHQAFVLFQEEVTKNQSLGIEVEIFPAGQLGNAKELFDTVQQGNLDSTALATVLLSPSIPEFSVLDTFYLFTSTQHAHKVLDGRAGKRLLNILEPKALHGLGYMEVGMRNISNSRSPINSVQDLKGLKIRAASNPLQIAAWSFVGAAPIPMSFGEIFISLQQGLLDGQESAVSSMYTQKFFEAQKYISITEHIYTNYVWVINKRFWEMLNKQEQDVLSSIANKTISKQRLLAQKFNDNYLNLLANEGKIQKNTVSTEVRMQLAEKLNAPIKMKIKELTGDALYNFVIEEVKRAK